ncbi:MAG: hypothetical protein ACE5EJ_04205 [Nitrosopumilaceae archaeon]
MGDFSPKTPVPIQIRKIIFEKFNDIEVRFTNDEIFELIKKNSDIDESWTIDDMEPYFKEICDNGLTRNIAQNFTTIWLKLFDPVEKFHCNSCNNDVYLGKSEDRVCPNPDCKATI